LVLSGLDWAQKTVADAVIWHCRNVWKGSNDVAGLEQEMSTCDGWWKVTGCFIAIDSLVTAGPRQEGSYSKHTHAVYKHVRC